MSSLCFFGLKWIPSSCRLEGCPKGCWHKWNWSFSARSFGVVYLMTVFFLKLGIEQADRCQYIQLVQICRLVFLQRNFRQELLWCWSFASTNRMKENLRSPFKGEVFVIHMISIYTLSTKILLTSLQIFENTNLQELHFYFSVRCCESSGLVGAKER